MATEKRLHACRPSEDTLTCADVVVICVSTPSLKAGGVDTRPLQRVLASIGQAVKGRTAPLTVIVRSTVAPNRLRQLSAALPPEARQAIRLVANPEFLRETTAIADFEKPPFILVGGDDEEALAKAAALYVGIDAPIHKVSLESALLVKYASNAYHALKIAFANEMATVAHALGADPRSVMSIFSEDRILNISPAYLRPGFAFGGSCLPKDVRASGRTGTRECAAALAFAFRTGIESFAHRNGSGCGGCLGCQQGSAIGTVVQAKYRRCAQSPYVLLAELLVGRGMAVKVFDPDVDIEHAPLGRTANTLPNISRAWPR